MRYALTGRVVTIDQDWTVLEHGAVYIADDRIVHVLPAAEPAPDDFADAPRIATRGTIYPGLIELHNHLSYNALPLWPPARAYRNRGEWQVVPDYRKWVSGPMTVLGKTVGLSEAVVRYVECKCLVGGVTTSQGIALYSNNGIQAYYRGNIRNVESTQEADLIDADTRIPDVDARDAEAFLTRLRKTHRLILHLAEGLGPTAREHFTALHLADGRWALAPSLVGDPRQRARSGATSGSLPRTASGWSGRRSATCCCTAGRRTSRPRMPRASRSRSGPTGRRAAAATCSPS